MDISLLLLITGMVLTFVLITNVTYYLLQTPEQTPTPLHPRTIYQVIGYAALWLSYGLSVLRLPFAIIPYLTKLMFFVLTRRAFETLWRNSYPIQLLRIIGDYINLPLTIFMLYNAAPTDASLIRGILAASVTAECVRLITEKGQMLVSAIWQMLPHQAVAARLQHSSFWSKALTRYITYYSLSGEQRLDHILQWLKLRASCDREAWCKLAYTKGFRVVANTHGLGAGRVRDVARGLIYIHRSWTNDPWLLIGLVMRRGAWLFDPRYLRRPFYYRTESNRLASLFVLMHPLYSPPFAIYQFGHEIKVARYHLFHLVLGWLGIHIERAIQEDGTHPFDELIDRVDKALGWSSINEHNQPMKSNEQIIAEVIQAAKNGIPPTPMEIAERYCYPVQYVEDVLMSEIEAAHVEINQANA